VSVPTHLGDHPSVRVAEACAVHGTEVVARWCADLLDGTVAPDDPSAPSLLFLGGPHAGMLLDTNGWTQPANEYWPRVWAARGLLYAWTPAAAPSVVSALDDPAWRVREMAGKVARLREIGEASDALAPLVDDDVPRVRGAAIRALALVGEGEHAELIRAHADDPDPAVRRAVETALSTMRTRLDRDL